MSSGSQRVLFDLLGEGAQGDGGTGGHDGDANAERLNSVAVHSRVRKVSYQIDR